MSRRVWTLLLALVTALLVAVPASAMAAPRGTGGGAGTGGGGSGRPPGGGETTVTNNLSVPAVFVGGAGFGLTNPALQPPTGDPSTGYEVAGSYYVQGQNKWQAEYAVQDSDVATAKWGDNLTGSAMKQVGHQIRVEVNLTSTTVTGQGYTVVKLNPSQADNVSPWGTAAPASAVTGPARVWVAGAYLTINGGPAIATPGEINASGAVTFGYNWKPTAAGTYTLTFHVPSGVAIANGDTPSSSTLQVAITAGGSGGGARR